MIKLVHCNVENDIGGKDIGGIVIVRLAKGQRIKLRGVAIKGKGSIHTKWSPVITCTYQPMPMVTLNHSLFNEFSKEEKLRFVNSCSQEVYSYNSDIERVDVEIENACTFCNECKIVAENFNQPELVHIEKNFNRFSFIVETTGVLTPMEVINSAINIMKEKNVIEGNLTKLNL